MSVILKLGRTLLDQLNDSGIRYCHWKNSDQVLNGLSGEDDLDFLVGRGDYQEFQQLICKLGFIEAFNRQITFPDVFHYYGLDKDTGSILHLHIYFRVITGESHTKGYHFPVEDALIASATPDSNGCMIPDPEWQSWLFFVRYYIKASCVPGYILLARNKNKYIGELKYIRDNLPGDNLDREFTEQWQRPGGFVLEELEDWGLENTPRARDVIKGMWVRCRVSRYRRYGLFKSFFHRYFQIAYRLVNYFVLHKRKRLSTGCLIAVVGSDGTGKTTTIGMLDKWLSAQFDVEPVHFGRPNATLITWPFRLALFLYRRTRRHGDESRSGAGATGKGSLVSDIRYLVLAYERARLYRKAERCVSRGMIVVSDRYPSRDAGKMDSPRVSGGGVSGNPLRMWMEAKERELYQGMSNADLLIKLSVPLEEAKKRNRLRQKEGKEPDQVIENRHREYESMSYSAGVVEVIDASRTLEETMLDVKRIVWHVL